MKCLIIMWYGYSRRAKSLSKELGADLLLVDTVITKNQRFRKYLLWFDYLIKTIKTFNYLIKNRPDFAIATSPPSFCPIISCLYCRIFNKKLVIDAHNSAFLKPWINVPFYKRILKNSHLILIHNNEFYEYLSKIYSDYNFFVLPDPLPDFEKSIKKNSTGLNNKYFLVILSFSSDEPVDLIFKSIKNYLQSSENNEYSFFITGNYLKNKKIYDEYSKIDGIQFLGFLSEENYEHVLLNSFAVITFSTKIMVQQSAAIEALGAGIPLISEDSKTNRGIFYKGAILTKLFETEIVHAIKLMISKNSELKTQVNQLKEEYLKGWEINKKNFINLVQ